MKDNQLIITQPDDWHIHLHEGGYLKTTVADASKYLARALIMPILKTPEDKDYIKMAAISGNKKFFAGTD